MLSVSLNEYTSIFNIGHNFNSKNLLPWDFTLKKGENVICFTNDMIVASEHSNHTNNFTLSFYNISSNITIKTADVNDNKIKITIDIELTMPRLGIDRKCRGGSSIIVNKPELKSPTQPITNNSVEKVNVVKSNPLRQQLKSTGCPTKDKHLDAIRLLLLKVDDACGRPNSIAAAIELFDYIRNDGLPFINTQPRFRDTTIDKCWEFKITEFDSVKLMASIDSLLAALGARFPPTTYARQYGRFNLLRELFKKENLKMTRETLSDYNSWCEEYDRNRPPMVWLNRYEKMREFIRLHRSKYTVLEQNKCCKNC
jgi:hypothetical protein